ncbi:MAG: hypothetical protein DWQ01_10900 [Planctomycetota bacterium]|nr:MAG: hypothetical protein DWQ01_10900 [Planctomycetota bacterium]
MNPRLSLSVQIRRKEKLFGLLRNTRPLRFSGLGFMSMRKGNAQWGRRGERGVLTRVGQVGGSVCFLFLTLVLLSFGGQVEEKVGNVKLGANIFDCWLVSSSGTGMIEKVQGASYLSAKRRGFWLIDNIGIRASMEEQTTGDSYRMFRSADVFGNLTSSIPQVYLPRDFPYIFPVAEVLSQVLCETAMVAYTRLQVNDVFLQVEGYFYEGNTMERAFNRKEKTGSFELVYLLKRSEKSGE